MMLYSAEKSNETSLVTSDEDVENEGRPASGGGVHR